MIRLLTRPQAERDIEDIVVYIAIDNLEVAERFLLAFKECLERLSEFPLIGVERFSFRDERLQSLRMWQIPSFEKYLVFYTVSDETIDIVRVLHSSRDISTILAKFPESD